MPFCQPVMEIFLQQCSFYASLLKTLPQGEKKLYIYVVSFVSNKAVLLAGALDMPNLGKSLHFSCS